MTGWPEARQAARDAAKPLEAIEVPLPAALGATLAEPLTAHTPMPAFDTSAMDGYAVAGRPPWTLVGEVRAGGRWVPVVPREVNGGADGTTSRDVDPTSAPGCRTEQPVLPPGRAVAISTGAPVPRGADAVLPVERSARVGMTVVGEVRAGQHIRRAGEDAERGRELLGAGVVVSAAALGLAAAVGHDVLLVHRRPRVAVVLTGDEVIRRGTPGVGQVRDAIGPVLPGVLAAAGADLVDVGHVPDRAEPLAEALLREDVDVVLVAGATSRGP
ncbi:MAG TPA: molybdopterin-binding protein, partial [Umezawaea sp.]|nr:molybdopterin-binding protein [Umezawaea sp.]